ncbi:ATP-binding cassette domain-containing protein [Chitinispirillales bacterium ANBcel5]|uniref:ABC transporter ATP-binding protein n=1 Tax=Cellulosispirillum alkaliphilum TaxID=3039283 RepID=UPI002A512243|nr:ATP-binding cassette domain-containing protein [Chitinispirillales bacterium ANBcel5]
MVAPLQNSLKQQVIVSIRNLTVKYGERTVLNRINTAFFDSEIRVILGTSGCGKTTLLKSIIGLLNIHSGTVTIFGHELGDPEEVESAKLLRKIGVLFQNGALLGSLSVEENIALPLQMHTSLPEKLIKEMVRFKLSQVDLPHAARLYPGELSGGMRKRAALARALILDPPLLFCDEPSAGLDPVTSAGLDELLLKLRSTLGITIVVVTHELFSIETIADKILFLNEGKVLFDGKLDDARKITEGPINRFFCRQESNSNTSEAKKERFNLEYDS